MQPLLDLSIANDALNWLIKISTAEQFYKQTLF